MTLDFKEENEKLLKIVDKHWKERYEDEVNKVGLAKAHVLANKYYDPMLDTFCIKDADELLEILEGDNNGSI